MSETVEEAVERLAVSLSKLPCLRGYSAVDWASNGVTVANGVRSRRLSFVLPDNPALNNLRITVTQHEVYGRRLQYYINHHCVTGKNIEQELALFMVRRRLGVAG